jgi:cyanate permease
MAAGCAVAVAIFVGFSNGAGWQTYLPVFLLGATTLGWNGVHMAELARAADEGAAGEVTSAAVLFGFVGAFAGPLAFVLIAHASGSYAVAFVVVTVPLPLVAIAALYCRPKDARLS